MQVVLSIGCVAALLLIGAGLFRLATVISRSGIIIKLLAQEAEGQELSGTPETAAVPKSPTSLNPFKWRASPAVPAPLPTAGLVNNGEPNVISDADEIMFEEIVRNEDIVDQMRQATGQKSHEERYA